MKNSGENSRVQASGIPDRKEHPALTDAEKADGKAAKDAGKPEKGAATGAGKTDAETATETGTPDDEAATDVTETGHALRHPDRIRKIVKYSSVGGIIVCIIIMILAWRGGYLTSQEKLQKLVTDAGVLGIVLFFFIQIVQVIIPIIPGGVSCLVGVVLYGPVGGFLVNYTGICIGSMCAFAIARYYGRPILFSLFDERTISKYDNWTEERQRFAKLFAIAIFFPVAPDDFLCYLAGTTRMKWKTYNLIIWLGKPFSIALYSLGLVLVFSHLKDWLMGLAG